MGVDNPDIPVSEFMDALDEVKSEGLINLVGASNWELGRFSEAREKQHVEEKRMWDSVIQTHEKNSEENVEICNDKP